MRKNRNYTCRGEVTVTLALDNLTVNTSSPKKAKEIARTRAIQAWVAMGGLLTGDAIQRMLTDDLPPVAVPMTKASGCYKTAVTKIQGDAKSSKN